MRKGVAELVVRAAFGDAVGDSQGGIGVCRRTLIPLEGRGWEYGGTVGSKDRLQPEARIHHPV